MHRKFVGQSKNENRTRAPGNDGVTAEMLQWAPKALLNRLIHLVQQVWDATRDSTDEAEADEWPEDWLQAIVIPLWKKKHPKSNKGNWRGTTLLSVGAKIVARIVASRLQKLSETFMDEEQQGFRKNRSVDDVLQITRRLVEEICFSCTGTPVVLTLYDIEKAYPRVTREALWQLLEKRGELPSRSFVYAKHCIITQTSPSAHLASCRKNTPRIAA